MQRPRPDLDYATPYEAYVSRVPESDVLPVLAEQPQRLRELANSLPAEREGFRYAEGKWSVREVVGHLTDSERVFGYRAFSIARGEQQPLPSFDEQAYIANSVYGLWPLANILAEFDQLRSGHLAMFRRYDRAAWERVGTAAGKTVSVHALAFIMAGHVRHHLAVLQERYGLAF